MDTYIHMVRMWVMFAYIASVGIVPLSCDMLGFDSSTYTRMHTHTYIHTTYIHTRGAGVGHVCKHRVCSHSATVMRYAGISQQHIHIHAYTHMVQVWVMFAYIASVVIVPLSCDMLGFDWRFAVYYRITQSFLQSQVCIWFYTGAVLFV